MNKINFEYETQVEVFSSEGFNSQVPSKLEEAISFFQEKLNSIPAEYRKDAVLNIEGYNEYDYSYARVEIYYYRPPTSGEISDRKETEKERARSQLKWAEDNYKRLKAQVGE